MSDESMMITFNVIYIVAIKTISFVLSSIFDRRRKEIFERGYNKTPPYFVKAPGGCGWSFDW